MGSYPDPPIASCRTDHWSLGTAVCFLIELALCVPPFDFVCCPLQLALGQQGAVLTKEFEFFLLTLPNGNGECVLADGFMKDASLY